MAEPRLTGRTAQACLLQKVLDFETVLINTSDASWEHRKEQQVRAKLSPRHGPINNDIAYKKAVFPFDRINIGASLRSLYPV